MAGAYHGKGMEWLECREEISWIWAFFVPSSKFTAAKSILSSLAKSLREVGHCQPHGVNINVAARRRVNASWNQDIVSQIASSAPGFTQPDLHPIWTMIDQVIDNYQLIR